MSLDRNLKYNLIFRNYEISRDYSEKQNVIVLFKKKKQEKCA